VTHVNDEIPRHETSQIPHFILTVLKVNLIVEINMDVLCVFPQCSDFSMFLSAVEFNEHQQKVQNARKTTWRPWTVGGQTWLFLQAEEDFLGRKQEKTTLNLVLFSQPAGAASRESASV
jgi:hypothetical protein